MRIALDRMIDQRHEKNGLKDDLQTIFFSLKIEL